MMNPNTRICNIWNKYASTYEDAAKISHEIGNRLFERLQYLTIQPQYILDLGCGTGVFSKALQKHYPKAHIIGLDIAHAMLMHAKQKQCWYKKWPLVEGDMHRLPFAEGVFDLIFANQILHYTDTSVNTLRELNRVMRPDGCLMFSTLGPDTFRELKQAWKSVDNAQHIHDFMDMHNLGDYLLAEHFIDPVVDMDYISAHYTSVHLLLDNLRKQGIYNCNPARHKGLTSTRTWNKFLAVMEAHRTHTGKFPLTYEVVYGHAWKGTQRRTAMGTETFISIDHVRQSIKAIR